MFCIITPGAVFYRIEIDNILDLNFLTHNYKCFVSQKQLLKYVF